MNNFTKKGSTALSLEQFASRLVRLMPRLMRRLMTQDRNYLARGLITLPQLWVLHQVVEQKTCTMRLLAKALALKSSTLTGLVDRLVALGLLKRFNSQSDRRVVLTTITSKGRRILLQLNAERHKSIVRMFRSISQRERTVYLGILEKILKTFTTAEDRGSGDAGSRNRLV